MSEPGRLKIVISAISKNESKHVERFCTAAKDADAIYVADTGSDDGTVDMLLENGAIVNLIAINPWRFDDARNAALAMLPNDVDVVVSLDLDEVLQPGWRDEIERVWVEGTTRLRYGFDWGAGIVFRYEKIFSRRGYRWFGPCHEYPTPDRISEVWAYTDKLLVIHQPDRTKSRGQYLDLLRISVEENPTEPRNAFYYGRELSFHNLWRRSIEQCELYLDLPRANVPNERCYAMRVISKCHQELGDWDASLRWLRRAASESPDTREPWCELAAACYRTQRWGECFGAAMTCLSITQRPWLYTCDPAVWGFAAHDYASIAAWNLGMKEAAIDQAKKAIELAPDDIRLRRNLEMMSERAA